MTEWKKIRKKNYKKDRWVQYRDGFVNFNPKSMDEFNPGDFKSYDEYIDIQAASIDKSRKYFRKSYHLNEYVEFTGMIERITKTNILFKRILISGMYMDGLGFEGKEDHVWMDIKGFEDYKCGDRLNFSAEIYRYLKKNNGKLIDYGLRNPKYIKVVEEYEVPSDEDLINQQIEQLVCETCLFTDHCYMGMCIANEEERQDTFNFLKQLEPGKFTPHTVLAAYEISGRVFSQLTGGKLDKNAPDYEISKKILDEASKRNAGCVFPLENALARILCPEKPRMYIE